MQHYRLYRSPTLVVRNVPTMQVRNVTNYQTRNRAACSFPQSCYCLFIVKQLIYFINVQCQRTKTILKASTWQMPVQTTRTFCWLSMLLDWTTCWLSLQGMWNLELYKNIKTNLWKLTGLRLKYERLIPISRWLITCFNPDTHINVTWEITAEEVIANGVLPSVKILLLP